MFAVTEFGLYDDYFHPLKIFRTVDDVLIMLAQGGFDLSDVFTVWGEDRSLGGLLAYRELLGSCDFTHRRLDNAFSTDAINNCVFSWVCDQTTVAHFRDSAWHWALDRENPELDKQWYDGDTIRKVVEALWQVLMDGSPDGGGGPALPPGHDYARLLERLQQAGE